MATSSELSRGVPCTPVHPVHQGAGIWVQTSLSICNGREERGLHHNTVYRKPTHTDRYLHYSSHHHGRQLLLLSATCSLCDRAHNVCDSSSRWEELTHLSKVFHSNGYPKPLVRRTSKSKQEGLMKRRERTKMRKVREDTTETERPKILCLPYIRGESERIEWGCQQLGVHAVFKSGHKLRHVPDESKNSSQKRKEERCCV